MSIPAHVTVKGPNGQRGARRKRIRLAAGRVDSPGDARDIVIHDLSAGGCSFAGQHPIPPGTRIRLRIPQAGEVAARTSWAQGGQVGCAFDRPLAPEVLAAALSGSPVIWGDFGKAEATPPITSEAGGETDRERPAVLTVALIGMALAGFWAVVAAIV
ncbi:MAG: PilZ domain-containing protein [Sphingomonas sp.]